MANDDWERWYAALKAVEPAAYWKALEYGQAIGLRYPTISEKVAAEIEKSHVMLACTLLRVQP